MNFQMTGSESADFSEFADVIATSVDWGEKCITEKRQKWELSRQEMTNGVKVSSVATFRSNDRLYSISMSVENGRVGYRIGLHLVVAATDGCHGVVDRRMKLRQG